MADVPSVADELPLAPEPAEPPPSKPPPCLAPSLFRPHLETGSRPYPIRWHVGVGLSAGFLLSLIALALLPIAWLLDVLQRPIPLIMADPVCTFLLGPILVGLLLFTVVLHQSILVWVRRWARWPIWLIATALSGPILVLGAWCLVAAGSSVLLLFGLGLIGTPVSVSRLNRWIGAFRDIRRHDRKTREELRKQQEEQATI